MIYAIDFDGTLCEDRFPEIGKELPERIEYLKALQKQGHKLILYTMRSGKYLEDAVGWFKERGIPLWGINENPTQSAWTKSPKVYANMYIDDAACGCPLTYDKLESRPFVDWDAIKIILLRNGIIRHIESESRCI